MKKTIFRCSIIACALALTSCVDNEENRANAEISYYATCENISFFDENDIVYKELIEESLDSLKLTGENSIFKQKGRSNKQPHGICSQWHTIIHSARDKLKICQDIPQCECHICRGHNRGQQERVYKKPYVRA